jgi:hypothetical protein
MHGARDESRQRYTDLAAGRQFAALVGICLSFWSGSLIAQTASVLTAELKAPIQVILTDQGNLLVAEAGNGSNTGRVSLVNRTGYRRTVLDGLPSGLSAPNQDPLGPAGLVLRNSTLFILVGAGDVVQSGRRPGTDVPNTRGPSSPILSSVIAVQFEAPIDYLQGEFVLTPADHATLADGHALKLTSTGGEAQITLTLLTDFRDYVRVPNLIVRPSNPFSAATAGGSLFVVDAAMNTINTVNVHTGRSEVLTRFAPLPNPTPVGPPWLDPVPTGIHRAGNRLLVTFLSGFPFPPGLGQVRVVNIDSARDELLVGGLTMAIDVVPMARGRRGYLVLEFSTNPAVPEAPGRLLRFDSSDAPPVVVNAQLVSPTSMVLDRLTGELFVTEFFAGRLTRIVTQ